MKINMENQANKDMKLNQTEKVYDLNLVSSVQDRVEQASLLSVPICAITFSVAVGC